MKALQQQSVQRRPKMEPTRTVMLDEARTRVLASKAPSLKELRAKFASCAELPELSGKVKPTLA